MYLLFSGCNLAMARKGKGKKRAAVAPAASVATAVDLEDKDDGATQGQGSRARSDLREPCGQPRQSREDYNGTTLAWLAVLGAGNFLKDHLQAMRDEIRVRIHMFEIKAAALPAIDSQRTVNEQTRLV
jgi:hypothetical protein